MELASFVYKNVYRFDTQNLETDLIHRCCFFLCVTSADYLRAFVEEYSLSILQIERIPKHNLHAAL